VHSDIAIVPNWLCSLGASKQYSSHQGLSLHPVVYFDYVGLVCVVRL
jgi:hypothetical protein